MLFRELDRPAAFLGTTLIIRHPVSGSDGQPRYNPSVTMHGLKIGI